MSQSYHAVAFGHKQGVFDTFEEMKKYTKGFPQSIHKKFSSKQEAEKFIQECTPESTKLDDDQTGDKFFSVPRGKQIGIFVNFDEVKKSHAGYPKEAKMYKKFNKYADAKEYFDKFSKLQTENFQPPTDEVLPEKISSPTTVSKKGSPTKAEKAGPKAPSSEGSTSSLSQEVGSQANNSSASNNIKIDGTDEKSAQEVLEPSPAADKELISETVDESFVGDGSNSQKTMGMEVSAPKEEASHDEAVSKESAEEEAAVKPQEQSMTDIEQKVEETSIDEVNESSSSLLADEKMNSSSASQEQKKAEDTTQSSVVIDEGIILTDRVDKTTTNDEDVGELEEEEGTAAKKPRLEE